MEKEAPMDPESKEANEELNRYFAGKTPAEVDAANEAEDEAAMHTELDREGNIMRSEKNAMTREKAWCQHIMDGLHAYLESGTIEPDMPVEKLMDFLQEREGELARKLQDFPELPPLSEQEQGLPQTHEVSTEKARKGAEIRPVREMSMEELKEESSRLDQMRTAVEFSNAEAGFGMTRDEFIEFADLRSAELKKEVLKRMSGMSFGGTPSEDL